MSLTLDEIQSLVAALGVNIPEDILAQKAKAEEFKVRREKVATEAGGKPDDWRLKANFEEVLKRAVESARQQQFESALKLLAEAEQLLLQPDAPPPPPPPPTPEPPAAPSVAAGAPTTVGPKVRFAQLRLEWETQKKSVAGQLETLRNAILAEYNDSASVAATTKLDKILARFSTGLGETLDKLYTAAEPPSQKQFRDQSLVIASQYLSYVESDPLISHVEANPFVAVSIRTTLAGSLKAIKTELQASNV